MTKLTCIIIDDEPLALNLLERYALNTPFLQLVGKYTNAIQAVNEMHDKTVDLAFVDIQMPEMNGLEFSRLIGKHTKIVFTTAFDRYAIDGYKVNAIGYLLKPIAYSDFLEAANKAKELFDESKPTVKGRSMFIKSDYRLLQIEFDSILYIEGLKDYVKIHLKNDTKAITSLMNLKTLEEMLPSPMFLRVHRSYIVNMNNVKTVEHWRIVYDNIYVPIGDSYKQQFLDFIKQKMT